MAIASRREVREYAPEPLGAEVERRILEAGRIAGSSRNAQPWTFVVLQGAARERAAATVYSPGNVTGAAFVVAIVVSGRGRAEFDAGRATQNMLLAAWNEGVASCPNGLSDRDAVRAALDLDEDEAPAIVLTFGLPERRPDPAARSAAEWSARANRRPLDDVVRRLR